MNSLLPALELPLNSFNAEKDFAPFSIANSTKASRVPDVGGGPKTSIFIFGKLEFTSFQVLYGLSCNFDPSSFAGTFLARAR